MDIVVVVYIMVSICHMSLQHLSIKLHPKLCVVIKRQSTTVWLCTEIKEGGLRSESDTVEDNHY